MTPSLSKGGAETQLLKLATHLKQMGDQVLVISLKPLNEFPDIEQLGLEVVFLKNWSKKPFGNIKKLYQTMKAFKPDVVIAFMFIAIIFARTIKTLLRFKLISTIRISVIQKKWYLPFKLTGKLDDAVVYNSRASQLVFERKKLARKRGSVINNGIAIPEAADLKTAKAGTPFKWVCVGHFRWNKDYHTLFRAISILKDEHFTIDIIGELNGETWPQEWIEELGISDRVNLLGFKPDTRQYLLAADAFVLASHSEGMPNAILEAMACEKMVVVTDIDGNNELVSNADSGLLCIKSDERDLAQKMLQTMNMEQQERQKFARNGRKYIEEHFKQEKVMKSWSKLIEEVTNQK